MNDSDRESPAEALFTLRAESVGLLTDWARLTVPHYGPSGSLDLDLALFPDADGPSYYNQFAHYPLLLLSEGVAPGLEAAEADRFRDIAIRNIDYILGITDERFQTPHYSRGRDWGRHTGEWIHNFLFRSARLVHERKLGGRAFRERLDEVILGGTNVLHQSTRRLVDRDGLEGKTYLGNHFSWTMLLLYEAGQYYGRAEWVALAERCFREHILARQQANGCWPEAGGIVVNYGMVTAYAVDSYAHLSGDPAAFQAVGRAYRLFRMLSFPDGASSVAADCRMRYSDRPFALLPLWFLQCSGGTAFCLSHVRGLRRCLSAEGVSDNAGHGLAFFGDVAERLLHASDDAPASTVADVSHPDVPVARVENDTWTAMLSWQLNAESPSGFHLDAQNMVEVWRRDAGYLVGGGNSKYAPRFSTLRCTTGSRGYIPTAARPIAVDAAHATAEYAFGQDRLRVAVRIDGEALRVGFSVVGEPEAGAVYEAALFLVIRPDETLSLAGTDIHMHPSRRVDHAFAASSTDFLWRACTFSVPAGARLYYPLVPHHPYTQDTLPSPRDYVARLSVRLETGQATILIR